jgi:hypothetical protein
MFFIAHLCYEVLHLLHCFSRGEVVGARVGGEVEDPETNDEAKAKSLIFQKVTMYCTRTWHKLMEAGVGAGMRLFSIHIKLQ